jgi:polyisoprenyl-phosphate glycosyltransferase
MVKKISVIYSFRNEQKLLEELIIRTEKVLSEWDYEIIFVNDSSNDGSLELLTKHSNKNEKIKIITMSGIFGQSQCLLAGLRYCTGDAAIYSDADLQDPPELFPKMIQEWKNGADVVNMVREKRKGENIMKMFLTKIGYLLWNVFSKIKIQKEVGDFKLLDKKVVEKVCQIDEEEPFLRGYVQWIGYKQVNLNYIREARKEGETHYPFFGGNPIETFIIGLTSFSITPLYLTIPSFVFSVIVSFCYVLFHTEFNIWFFLVALMINLQLLSLLFISIYLGRLHIQSRNRPLYNVMSTINIKDVI